MLLLQRGHYTADPLQRPDQPVRVRRAAAAEFGKLENLRLNHGATQTGVRRLRVKVDAMDVKVDEVKAQNDATSAKVDVLDGRMVAVEAKVDVVDGKLNQVLQILNHNPAQGVVAQNGNGAAQNGVPLDKAKHWGKTRVPQPAGYAGAVVTQMHAATQFALAISNGAHDNVADHNGDHITSLIGLVEEQEHLQTAIGRVVGRRGLKETAIKLRQLLKDSHDMTYKKLPGQNSARAHDI